MIDGQFSGRILDYLASSGKRLDAALLREAGARCTRSIERQLMQERESSKGKLRASSAGQCARKLWYTYTGQEGEPLQPRALMTFLCGDLMEVGLSVVARLAGWKMIGKSGNPDEEPSLDVVLPSGKMVQGHPDDLLHNEEEQKFYLVEFKSANEYGFEEFVKNGLSDTFGYATQVSLYLDSLSLKHGIVCYVCKTNGQIADRVVSRDASLVAKAKLRLDGILAGQEPGREHSPVPETEYDRKTKRREPTGMMVLPVQCAYCAFRDKCWAGCVTKETKGGKPVWVVNDIPV